jgi:hypothetical protein
VGTRLVALAIGVTFDLLVFLDGRADVVGCRA